MPLFHKLGKECGKLIALRYRYGVKYKHHLPKGMTYVEDTNLF